jgi:secreted trypsin-like serine protease
MKTLIAPTLLSVLVGTLVAPCRGIINGAAPTATARFPYFASLVDSTEAHQCGGTLIAPDLIMTAASCATTLT